MEQESIAKCLAAFKNTKNPYHLLNAIILVVRQRKIDEVLFGVYCLLFSKPSDVIIQTDNDREEGMKMAKVAADIYREQPFFTRDDLIKHFGATYDVAALPPGFTGCRTESVAEINELLIVGDYDTTDTSATIAIISKHKCTVNNYYNELRGVLHIHSIHPVNDSELIISTGDTKKLTDLWVIDGNDIRFKKRLKRYLAGYTAAAKINDQHFFGTDFSGRPNFITTLDGDRYFFPAKANRKYVEAFYAFSDRYIASINVDLGCLGNETTMSIFDTARKQFIFCEDYNRQAGIFPAQDS